MSVFRIFRFELRDVSPVELAALFDEFLEAVGPIGSLHDVHGAVVVFEAELVFFSHIGEGVLDVLAGVDAREVEGEEWYADVFARKNERPHNGYFGIVAK